MQIFNDCLSFLVVHQTIFYSLFLWMNILSFVLFGADKRRAQKGRYRVSERGLLLFAFFFGGLGAFSGMLLFHHKTKKKKFILFVPLCALLQTGLLLFMINSSVSGL